MKLAYALLALALSLLSSGCAQKSGPQMVEAGGYKVRMLVEGEGSPAVVFIGGGFGAWLETWESVRAKKDKEEMDKGATEMNQGGRYEYEQMETSFQQAREAWPLPAVPNVLFTSIHPSSNDRLIWLDLHKEFLTRLPGAKHIVTEKSGHNIAGDEPDLVVDAIREIVKEKSNRPR